MPPLVIAVLSTITVIHAFIYTCSDKGMDASRQGRPEHYTNTEATAPPVAVQTKSETIHQSALLSARLNPNFPQD